MTTAPDNQSIESQPNQKVVYVLQQFDAAGGADEIELAQLVRAVWRRRWWIGGFTALVTALAVAYAMTATEWYRAEAIVAPREGPAGTGLLAQLGGLAGLAGISVGSGARQEPMAVLRSKGFARRFVERNGLLHVLANRARQGSSDGGVGDTAAPDIRLVVDGFVRSVMAIEEDKKSGLITIAVEWKDPKLAADWANMLVAQLNDEMRMRSLAEAEQNIRYLKEQLATTDTVSLQQPIARLLETEMQKLMLARGAGEFSLRTIDPAEPPATRAKPKRRIVVMLSFVGGLLFSVFCAAIFDPVRRFMASALAK